MPNTIRLALVLHNHQPVGNFDGVIEQAFQESYRPFLEVFRQFPSLRIGLHTSGSLMEWLAARHPEYLDELAELVAGGRIEIVGGAYYEPILSMIPKRDCVGQIRSYTQWLERRLACKVRGMWIPERVWEPTMVSELVEAGIEYTVLDDFHFRNAGVAPEHLDGYFISENDGEIVAVFPGSERLRYTIPFQDPQATIEHLRSIADRRPDAVVVFGDDGEKFGSWPETFRHVYQDGWLHRFFSALVANEDWLRTTTLAEAIDNVPPNGKIYLPDSSYREMTEWALPSAQLMEYERLRHDLEHDSHWPSLSRFVRGGFWRNFKVKYPEADEMYTRMLMVSRRLSEAEQQGQNRRLIDAARTELYRSQCNCTYWHGAFGGIYLPHLRNAVYRGLIAADNLLDQAAGRTETWIEATVGDFNLDARQEVYLANDKLATLIRPWRGGLMYELDVREICHNLLATMSRQPEAYHRKVLAGAGASDHGVGSIHDRVVFKQPDLNERLQYDTYPRKSLVDHFYDQDVTIAAIAGGRAQERGDFATGTYEARLRRNPDRIQVQLSRQGNAWGHPVKITKGITMEAGSANLEIAYLLEGLPAGQQFHFSVEFNFAGLPSGCEDRYFYDGDRRRLGHLGEQLDLRESSSIGLVDEYLGIDVALKSSRAGGLWTYPVETVSQSEGGFELVHQSVVVQPHWIVEADAAGRWIVTMELAIDTSLAERRRRQPALATAH